MGKVDVYLSLGSNLGSRTGNLEKAMKLLDQLLEPRAVVSDTFETAPWGFASQHPFLNNVVIYELPTQGWWKGEEPEPLEVKDHALWILDRCKQVEVMMGRSDKEEYDAAGERIYHDRPIDIDILFYGTHRVDTPRLILPHKLMSDREFVMFPLRQIVRDDVREAFPDIFQAK